MMLLTRFGDEGNRATMMKLTVGMQAIFIAVTVFASLNILSHDVSDISLGAPDAGMSKIAASSSAHAAVPRYLMPKATATRPSAFACRGPRKAMPRGRKASASARARPSPPASS